MLSHLSRHVKERPVPRCTSGRGREAVRGASIVEVARQAGHSPAVALNVYAHVIEELEGGERRSAEAVIREARDARVPWCARRPATRHPSHAQTRTTNEADARTRTGDPFITSEVLYQLSYVGRVGPV
jgi:hypothetical protein